MKRLLSAIGLTAVFFVFLWLMVQFFKLFGLFNQWLTATYDLAAQSVINAEFFAFEFVMISIVAYTLLGAIYKKSN